MVISFTIIKLPSLRPSYNRYYTTVRIILYTPPAYVNFFKNAQPVLKNLRIHHTITDQTDEYWIQTMTSSSHTTLHMTDSYHTNTSENLNGWSPYNVCKCSIRTITEDSRINQERCQWIVKSTNLVHHLYTRLPCDITASQEKKLLLLWVHRSEMDQSMRNALQGSDLRKKKRKEKIQFSVDTRINNNFHNYCIITIKVTKASSPTKLPLLR